MGVPDRAPGFVGVRTKGAEVVAAGAVVAAGEVEVRLTTKQRAVLEAITPRRAVTEVCRTVGVGPGVVRTLARKGLVVLGPAPAQPLQTAHRDGSTESRRNTEPAPRTGGGGRRADCRLRGARPGPAYCGE